MRYTLVIAILLYTMTTWAQIETDRPDYTESPNVVPKGALQVETGFILENDKKTKGIPLGGAWQETYRNTTANTTLLRYGLTEKVELRLNYAYSIAKLEEYKVLKAGPGVPSYQSNDPIFNPSKGVSSTFIGFKTNLYKSDKVSIGFLGHLYLPRLTSGDFVYAPGQHVAPEFLIPLTYDITDRFGVAVQYGLSWNGVSPNPTTSYTLALGYSITEELSFYVEPYGYLTTDGDELHLINGGFTYLINDDILVDLTGGAGLNDIAPDNFIGCGVSFLLFNK